MNGTIIINAREVAGMEVFIFQAREDLEFAGSLEGYMRLMDPKTHFLEEQENLDLEEEMRAQLRANQDGELAEAFARWKAWAEERKQLIEESLRKLQAGSFSFCLNLPDDDFYYKAMVENACKRACNVSVEQSQMQDFLTDLSCWLGNMKFFWDYCGKLHQQILQESDTTILENLKRDLAQKRRCLAEQSKPFRQRIDQILTKYGAVFRKAP